MSWKDDNSLMCDTFTKRRHTPFHEEEWRRKIPSAYKTRCQVAYERCRALAQIGHPIPRETCTGYKVSANLIEAMINRRNARMGIMPSLPKDLPKLRFVEAKRKSPKRKSPKRKSPKRKSPKRI